jgi:hypothetical protein
MRILRTPAVMKTLLSKITREETLKRRVMWIMEIGLRSQS